MRRRRLSMRGAIILLILSIGIGYALLSTTLSINGTANFSKNTWNIKFANLVVDGDSTATTIYTNETGDQVDGNARIIDDTTIAFNIKLLQPGDYYVFETDIVNDGTIDAILNEIEDPNTILTDNQKRYITYSVNYVNESTGPTIDDELLAKKDEEDTNNVKRIRVFLKFKNDITSDDLNYVTDEPLSLIYKLKYIQK